MDLSYDIGFRLPSSGMSVDRQMYLGRDAADNGYDAVLTSETWGYEAFTRLGYLAAETNITLGTAIVPVHSRSPALLAQAAGTLSRLSSKKTLLGIGLSSPAVVEEWYGAEFEPALRRERETIEIVQAVLTENPLKYDGRLFDLDFDSLRFEPPDDVGVYVAAQGEKNTRLVGEFADGWMPTYIPLSKLEKANENIRAGAEKRGRDPEKIDTVPFLTTCVLDDGECAKKRCRATIAFYIGAMGEYHYQALANHGYRTTADQIREAWESGNYSQARSAVSDDLLADVALAGTPEDVREQLLSLEGDVDMLVTVPSTNATNEEVEETVRHMGKLAGRDD